VRGDEGDGARHAPLGQRQSGGGGAAQRGGDAGDDADGDAERVEVVDLLPGPAEDHRVAALQPHHAAAHPRLRGDQRVDLLLRPRVPAGALADAEALGGRVGEVEDAVADEVVVEDHVGRRQRLDRRDGQQVGVAGTGADQGDGALLGRMRLPPP